MSEKAIIRTSKTMILVFGLGFIGLLAGFYFNKVDKVSAEGPIDFVEHVVTDTADGVQDIYTEDVDSDGDMDMLSASYNDNTIAWYENDGNQNFTKHIITTTGSGGEARSVYAKDIDQDNDIDVLAIFRYSLEWYENDGSQNFTTHIITNTFNYGYVVYAEDVDNDNDIDILTGSSGTYGDHGLRWFENDGNQNFTQHNITGVAYSLYAKDIDNDNDTDIVIGNMAGVYWYENDGNQNFTSHDIIILAWSDYRSVYAIDMDSDNDIDILSASYNNDTIAWHENDGNQNFITHNILTSAYEATAVYAEDIDKDNDVDVLSTYMYHNTVAWHENDGNQNFTKHIISESAVGAIDIYAKDVDNDNNIDIISASQNNDSINWYENDDGINFDFTEHIVPTSTTNDPKSIYAVDINNDGHMDIVSALLEDDMIIWHKNDGYQNFTEHIITNSADGVGTIYAKDVNRDGNMDVLSASWYEDTVAWYENDGNENFSEHIITASIIDPMDVYAEDIDNDNNIDILTAAFNSDAILWYENDGNENFSEHVVVSSIDRPKSVYAVDINDDGHMDIVSAIYGENTIAWYENDGNENFSEHVISTSAQHANSVYAIDLDNDSDIDVVSASGLDNKIAWYENDGNENFSEHVISYLANGANDIYAKDLDNDSDIDIVSASASNDNVVWYENYGTGSFFRHVIKHTSDGSQAIYAENIDNDTDIDILTTSSVNGSIVWYENHLYEPAPACNDGIQNGDETGVDCGGSCQYSCVVPVILLHGIGSEVQDIYEMGTELQSRINSPVYFLDYAPGDCSEENYDGCTAKSIEEYAKKLADSVDYVQQANNARYVDLVGHSMGGLISRYYIQATNTNKVRNIIQVASPNHGALLFSNPYSWLFEEIYDLTDRSFNILHYTGVSFDQLAINSKFSWKLNGIGQFLHDSINTRVKYTTIGGTNCILNLCAIHELNDGIVSVWSLKIYNPSVNDPSLYFATHFNIKTNDGVLDQIASIINGTYVPEPTIPQERYDQTNFQTLSFIEDHASGPDYNNVNIDSADSISFLLIFRGEETSFTAESPDHTIYTATGEGQMKSIDIPSPLSGQWTLTASSTDADYQIFTFAETNTILEPDVPAEVLPGQNILISANLTTSSTPLIGAEVRAKIFDPDDNEYNINLTDQGNGTYTGIFSQTDNNGVHNVRIYASTTIAGEIVNREVYTIFQSVDNPDLTISSFTASFDDANYELELNAVIANLENVAADDFTLRFYDGEPGDIMSTMIKEIDFSLSALGEAQFTATTTPLAGTQTYYVTILKYDDEDSYDNNDDAFTLYIPSQCSDGTNPNQCSLNKPFYCVDGELVNNCQLCGCQTGYKCSQSTNMCVYYHEEEPIPMSML